MTTKIIKKNDDKSLAVPEEFQAMAAAYPDMVRRELAKLTTVEQTTAAIDKTGALVQYALRVKAGNKTINPIQYGNLLLIAHMMGLVPKSKGGRGKKSLTGLSSLGIGSPTIAAYRKVALNADRLR